MASKKRTEFWSEPPRDEQGRIHRDNITDDGLLKQGPRAKGSFGQPPKMYRPSENPVPAEIYLEALKERKQRQPSAGYYRIRDVHAESKRVVVSVSEKLVPLSVQNQLPDPRLMTDEELVMTAAEILKAMRYDWAANALPHQVEPDDYLTWLLCGGRGGGKTKCGSETVRKWATTKPGVYAVLALGHRELRDICMDGDSGLIAAFPPGEIVGVKKGLGDISIKLKNGSEIVGFTSGNPEALRGREFEACWVDEYGAYARSTAQDVIDQLWMCMRKSDDPKMLITTTPRKVEHIVSLFKLAEQKPERRIVITHMTTRDNPHLGQAAVQQLYDTYGGTRQGRQELDGALLLDVEGALWNDKLLSYAVMDREEDLPLMKKVIVGYDYAGSDTGDPAGVVAVGWDAEKCLYVLANWTTGGPPSERYGAACLCAYENHAAEIWYEGNQGDASKFGLEQQWKTLVEQGRISATARMPLILPSNIKGNKADRANPLVSLYERNAHSVEQGGRYYIRHISPTPTNKMAHLEHELTSWEPNSRLSPNGLDALVHAGRQAMIQVGYDTTFGRVNKEKRRLNLGWKP